jgi:DNA helicase II / ATP-dependent DNA helicase PcrA
VKLTKQQNMAVSCRKPRILVRSVAGSGKTTVIVSRIKSLLDEGVDSNKILVLTFTNKMANELKNKLPMLRWVGNFHGIGLRMINITRAKNGQQSLAAISGKEEEEIFKLIKKKVYWTAPDKSIRGMMTEHNNGHKVFSAKFDVFIKEYNRYFTRNGIVSFDNIEILWLKMLQDNDMNIIFEHVLVDEYQDTSITESKIVEALAPPNLYVTGDIAQNIYEWRGTCIDNIKNIEADEIIEQNETFRVPLKLMPLVNGVLEGNDMGYDAKVFSSVPGPSPVIKYMPVAEEVIAKEMKNDIKKLIMLYHPRDIMILCRTNRQIEYLSMELKDLPINSIRSSYGWNTGIGNSIVSFLRFCVDKGNYSVEKLLRTAKLEPEDVVVKWVNKSYIENKQLIDVALNDEVNKGALIREILSLIDRDIPIHRKVSIYYNSFIEPEYHSNIGAETTFNNCLDAIKFYEDNYTHSIAELLSWIITLNTQDMINDDSDEIRIMTYHTAKGLESPVVMMPWIEDGTFPSRMNPESIWAEKRLFYVGITRTKSLLYLYVTGKSVFIKEK